MSRDQSAKIFFENGNLIISGDLDFASVTKLFNASLPLLANYPEWCFDLSQVTSSNSAALALLLEWRRQAERQHKKIVFKNIPPQLVSVAAMAGITGLL